MWNDIFLQNLSKTEAKEKKQQWQFRVQSTLPELSILMNGAIHWILLLVLLLYLLHLEIENFLSEE